MPTVRLLHQGQGAPGQPHELAHHGPEVHVSPVRADLQVESFAPSPPTDTHKGVQVHLRLLPQVLLTQGSPRSPREAPRFRERRIIPLRRVRCDLQEQKDPNRTHEDPQRGQALQVHVVRVRIHPKGQSYAACAGRARRSGVPL